MRTTAVGAGATPTGERAARDDEAADGPRPDDGAGGEPRPDEPAEERVHVTPGRGRDAEFAAFAAAAGPALGRTAWLLCGDAHQAEELVQQALVRTYVAWSRAREGDPLAYARRVLANQRIDTWRRRRREVLVAPAEVPELAHDGRAQEHADRDQLVRALATLSARQRRVVVLRHLEGMSEREVAHDLGVSVGTVKSTASRALVRLRDVLGTPDGHEGSAR